MLLSTHRRQRHGAPPRPERDLVVRCAACGHSARNHEVGEGLHACARPLCDCADLALSPQPA